MVLWLYSQCHTPYCKEFGFLNRLFAFFVCEYTQLNIPKFGCSVGYILVCKVEPELIGKRVQNVYRVFIYAETLVFTRVSKKNGGGWWIRTTEVGDNRFTVCPLWPLGKSPMLRCLVRIGGILRKLLKYHGAGGQNRTGNLRITSALLYH